MHTHLYSHTGFNGTCVHDFQSYFSFLMQSTKGRIYACLPMVSMGFMFCISLPNCPDKNDYSSYIDSIPANPTPITEGSLPAVCTLKGTRAVQKYRTSGSEADGKQNHASQKASLSK